MEKEDHQDFRRAVPLFHKAGIRVFGYIQTSNCVYHGSHRDKDWYARDPKGRKIHYYTGRYMTCWEHPEWRAHLHRMAGEVVAAGADGVFFDNPWHGFPSLWVGESGWVRRGAAAPAAGMLFAGRRGWKYRRS